MGHKNKQYKMDPKPRTGWLQKMEKYSPSIVCDVNVDICRTLHTAKIGFLMLFNTKNTLFQR